MSADRPVVAMVQARTSSSRLPQKILEEICGVPMLLRVLQRLDKAQTLDKTVVAITKDLEDNVAEELCKQHGYTVFRGSSLDVLDRFYHAAFENEAETIVRITADSPLIDPQLIDELVTEFISPGCTAHYGSNRMRRTYPIGTDVEVFTREALIDAYKNCSDPYCREHVTPYMYRPEVHDEVLSVEGPLVCENIRLTVDTQEDLEMVRKIYQAFPPDGPETWLDIVRFLNQNEAVAELNRHVQQKHFTEIDHRWD